MAKVGLCTMCLMCSSFTKYIIYSVMCSAVSCNFYLYNTWIIIVRNVYLVVCNLTNVVCNCTIWLSKVRVI
jgi:hypothetical protein